MAYAHETSLKPHCNQLRLFLLASLTTNWCLEAASNYSLMPLQTLFDAAIEWASQREECGCGYQWYVYSYQAGYLLRRAAFILEKLGKHLAYESSILSARHSFMDAAIGLALELFCAMPVCSKLTPGGSDQQEHV